MTRRRVVALAQALTMFLLLTPGPHQFGPASVQAAIAPAEPLPAPVLDAAGRGIGCQAGTRKYRGPGLPKDPPWPPGAEPTPSPEPSPSPSADPGAASPADPESSSEPTASGPSAFVAAEIEHLVVQAEVPAQPAPEAGKFADFITGIDVSHHNGDIDYAMVREAGNRFVFIKATQDNDFIDPMFPTNLARARAAGLAAGAYHFFDYTLDGKSQADHFLDRVEAAGGIDDALPPVVDVECWTPIGPSIHAVSAARLRDFVERVYERTARMPIVYTSHHMWKEVVGNPEGFEELTLWAACWGCDVPPTLAAGWEQWAFWQTGTSRIPGVGRLDGNYFSGRKRDLEAMKLQPVALEAGDPVTARRRVEIDLGGRDGRHYRTSPDGVTWSGWTRLRSPAWAELGSGEGEQEVFVQLRNGPGLVSPVFRDAITLDRSGPELTTPQLSLREGPLTGEGWAVPVSVRWEALDVRAGLSDATVLASCDVGGSKRTEAPGTAAPGESVEWEAAVSLVASTPCSVTAIGRDGVGNTTRTTTGEVRVRLLDASTGREASATVDGNGVGLVARRGPDGGRAAVSIDGQAVGLVDLYAPEPGDPEIVYVAGLDGGSHSVAVEPTGTSDPASSGSSVVIDGFVTIAVGA